MRIPVALALLLLLAVVVPVGGATNLVKDPGFESAGASGYVFSPNTLPDGVWQQSAGMGYVLNSPPNAYGGNVSYFVAATAPTKGSVQQSLTTSVGTKYDLTFYYTYDSNGPITASFGGKAVTFTSTAVPNSQYFQAVADGMLASTATTVLAFSSTGGNTILDEVSVIAAPEPGSFCLLVMAGAGLFGRRRRRLSFLRTE